MLSDAGAASAARPRPVRPMPHLSRTVEIECVGDVRHRHMAQHPCPVIRGEGARDSKKLWFQLIISLPRHYMKAGR